MPTRRREVRTAADAVSVLAERVRTLEDTVSRRCLPPGYEFDVTGGVLVIIRLSDDAVIASFP